MFTADGPIQRGGKPAFPVNALASMVLSGYTTPKLICAENANKQRTDAGSTQTNRFFATRVRRRIIGRYKALAVVFVGRYWNFSVKRPFTTAMAENLCQIQCALELPNGTQTKAFSSPNTGGTLIPITWNGNATTNLYAGRLAVSDLIFPSSGDYFEFVDNNLSAPHQQPWLRTAFAKNTATDVVFMTPQRSVIAPLHDCVATGPDFATMQTLISTPGIASYNGANSWGAGDTDDIPSAMFLVGIPEDPNQEAVLFFGTSIADGETESPNARPGSYPNPFGTGTDWSDIFWDCGRLPGWTNWAMSDPARAFPGLNLAVGAGALASTFPSNEDAGLWGTFSPGITTYADFENQRSLVADISRYFTICIAHDVHNDNMTIPEYRRTLYNWTHTVRRANEQIKIFGARVPNGGVDINGSTIGYAAGLNDRWLEQEAMVANGWWTGMLDLRIGVANEFPNTGVISSGQVGAGSSTTVINVSVSDMPANYYTRSWIQIGSEVRIVSSNSNNQFTCSAFSVAPSAGTPYSILGNTAGGTNGLDFVHMNSHGARLTAAKFHEEILGKVPSFKTWLKPR